MSSLDSFFASIHPLVVHFPIALLTVYALLELVPLKKMWTDPRWILAKRVLLFFGTLGVFMAFRTGDLRGGEGIDAGSVLAYHKLFGTITVWIFSLLFAGQLIMASTVFVTRLVTKREWLYVIWKVLERIAGILAMRPVVIVCSIAGLVTLTITGALGGGMVYGPDADPMVSMVFKMLKLN